MSLATSVGNKHHNHYVQDKMRQALPCVRNYDAQNLGKSHKCYKCLTSVKSVKTITYWIEGYKLLNVLEIVMLKIWEMSQVLHVSQASLTGSKETSSCMC